MIDEFDNQLNQRINEDPELLQQKIENEVDYAIIAYEIEEQRNRAINMRNQNILEEINKPKYDNLQKLIVKNAIYYEFADGTMGIRGAWVAPDPREIPFE
jgi:anaerobic ribonucleoside-triphosphate reductase